MTTQIYETYLLHSCIFHCVSPQGGDSRRRYVHSHGHGHYDHGDGGGDVYAMTERRFRAFEGVSLPFVVVILLVVFAFNVTYSFSQFLKWRCKSI
jgi:hypothetical protein